MYVLYTILCMNQINNIKNNNLVILANIKQKFLTSASKFSSCYFI